MLLLLSFTTVSLKIYFIHNFAQKLSFNMLYREL